MKKEILTTITIMISLLLSMSIAFADLNDNLLSYYTFDTNTNDDYASNNAVNTGTTNITGKLYNARSFSGSSQYITLNTLTNELDGTFSISLWFKTDSVSGDHYIFEDWTGTGRNYLLRLSGNKINTLNGDGGSNQDTNQVGTTAISTGVWYHMVYVRNGTNSKLYINNNLDIDFTGSYSGGSTPNNIRIGTDESGGSAFWDGIIDEFYISTDALDSVDVSKLYNSNVGRFFNSTPTAPSGSTIINSSGVVTATGVGTQGTNVVNDGDAITYNYEFRCDNSSGTIKQTKSTDNTWLYDDSCTLDVVYVNVWGLQGGLESNNHESISINMNDPPIIDSYIILPVENSSINTDWIYYEYNASDGNNDTLTYNLSFYLNNILNNTFNSSSKNISIDIDGNYSLIMNISDGIQNTTSTPSWIYRKSLFNLTAYNDWNNTQLNIFTATVNGTNYQTNIGYILINIENELENITISKEEYIDNVILNHNTSLNLNKSIYQTEVNITPKEINTETAISEWTLITEKGSFYSPNSRLTIYPNYGTYNWNWTNNKNYFNASNLNFVVNEAEEVFNILDIFARNISFKDIYTNEKQDTKCTQDGYSQSGLQVLLHKSPSLITCNAFGYDVYTFNNTNYPDSTEYILEPVSLALNFSEKTEGIVQAGDTYILEFNNSIIQLNQSDIDKGFVKITFNKDSGNKYQQIYSYYNDQNTTIRDNILIQDIDLQQKIKVTGGSQALVNARVCAKYPLNESYYITYCDFTDDVGEVVIQVNDQNTYQFCAQIEGYEPNCKLEYIPDSNAETITIDLLSTVSKVGNNYVSSSCGGLYDDDTECILNVATYKPYYSICVNISKTIGNITSTVESCDYNSVGQTFLYTLEKFYTNYSIDVYLTGELSNTIKHLYGEYTPDNDINYQSGNNNGQTILDKIKDNVYYYIFIHILLTIIGVIAGMMMDKYFNGFGMYGTGLWFLFLGTASFYVFYIPAIGIMIYFIMERFLPMFKN